MRNGRYLTLDKGDFQFLSGETSYSWPIEQDQFVKMRVSGDQQIQIYAVESRTPSYMPIATGAEFTRELKLVGFDQIVLKAKATAHVAVQIETATAHSLDPLDYTPVEIDPPHSDTEKMLLEMALRKRLDELGIEIPAESVSEEPGDEDLEFFDDDGEIHGTNYQEPDPELLRALQAMNEEQVQSPEPPSSQQSGESRNRPATEGPTSQPRDENAARPDGSNE